MKNIQNGVIQSDEIFCNTETGAQQKTARCLQTKSYFKKSYMATALATFAIASTSAFAVDLVNKDSRTYQVSFEDGPSTIRSSIGSSTTQGGVCTKCKIVVEGVGSVEVKDKQVVVIKDGTLSIE